MRLTLYTDHQLNFFAIVLPSLACHCVISTASVTVARTSIVPGVLILIRFIAVTPFFSQSDQLMQSL
ncbi:MAG: hypothetical protein L0229_04540 [Blastocatellia bacterium]|nr:hypothetical protein [Blastocatellia bacterium]